MSDIREPANNESPTTPGDEGKATESTTSTMPIEATTPTDTTAPADAAAPGDAAAPADAAAPGDQGASGDGDDGTAEGTERSSQQGAVAEGAVSEGKRNKRRKKKRGAVQGEAAANAEGEGQQKSHSRAAQPPRAFKNGDKVRARVVEIVGATAILDLWGKEKGLIDLREVLSEDGATPAVGDAFDVEVIQDGSRGGSVVVTRDAERVQKGRALVKEAFETGKVVEAIVTGMNKGGLEMDVHGVRAFCPSSQIDARFPPSVSPKSLLHQRVECKVTALVDDGREAIVSRRAVVEASVRARAEELKSQIKPGDVVKGVVVAVKDYGVFVDLGGIEGLIHVTELSHNRGARPQDVCKVGDEIEAKVLKITAGEQPKPAEPKAEAANVPSSEGEVSTVEGAEAEAAKGAVVVQGDGEKAEASAGDEKGGRDGKASDNHGPHDKNEKRAKSQRAHGPALPRVILSRKAIEKDPWEDAGKKWPVGSVHTGKVARMQSFGAFVELAPGVDGLLHVSELGQGKHIEHPQDVLKLGQTVTVRVERVEKNHRRIALSLLPDGVTQEQLDKAVNVRVGLVAKARVIEHDGHGFLATIEGAIGKLATGYVSERDSGQPRGTDLKKALPVGTLINVKVIEIDRGRVKLSVREAARDEERQAYKAYQREATAKTVGTSLAEKLRGLLNKRG
jgi:small subunit ribosomal protein S1